jgi:hypothetical protein
MILVATNLSTTVSFHSSIIARTVACITYPYLAWRSFLGRAPAFSPKPSPFLLGSSISTDRGFDATITPHIFSS